VQHAAQRVQLLAQLHLPPAKRFVVAVGVARVERAVTREQNGAKNGEVALCLLERALQVQHDLLVVHKFSFGPAHAVSASGGGGSSGSST
jgi:hypothetical protein